MRPLFALFLLSATVDARPRHVESGPGRASVLELYTSEGCASCPRVETLLNALASRFAGRVFLLAFHVDYWDGLGWPDRFADHRWTERQRGRSPHHYTPQVLLNGSELADLPLELPSASPRAQLSLELTGNRVTFRSSGGESVFLVLSESGLAVDVKAGENRGRTLHHDHVVRALWGPFPAGRSFSQTLAIDPKWRPARLTLTAFVEDDAGEVLQAIELPFTE